MLFVLWNPLVSLRLLEKQVLPLDPGKRLWSRQWYDQYGQGPGNLACYCRDAASTCYLEECSGPGTAKQCKLWKRSACLIKCCNYISGSKLAPLLIVEQVRELRSTLLTSIISTTLWDRLACRMENIGYAGSMWVSRDSRQCPRDQNEPLFLGDDAVIPETIHARSTRLMPVVARSDTADETRLVRRTRKREVTDRTSLKTMSQNSLFIG